MSNERNSIRFRTGANDNLVSILGDLVSSDGARTFRVPLGTPGQVLTVDLNAECGISWNAPSISAEDPTTAFKPRGLYIPAGVDKDGQFTDFDVWCEGQASTITANFGLHIFAYPEVSPFDGIVSSLAAYYDGGPPSGPCFWIGVARNTVDSNGNAYPGTIVDHFAYVHSAGFDGPFLREGAVNVPISKGELFWIVTQVNNLHSDCWGYRDSVCYRNVFGNTTPATFVAGAGAPRARIGWMTTAPAAYNPLLAAFPAEANASYLTQGPSPIAPGGGSTTRRRSVYFKLQES